MRRIRGKRCGFDGLDVAAVWPSSLAVGGLPLPQMDRPPSHRGGGSEQEEDG